MPLSSREIIAATARLPERAYSGGITRLQGPPDIEITTSQSRQYIGERFDHRRHPVRIGVKQGFGVDQDADMTGNEHQIAALAPSIIDRSEGIALLIAVTRTSDAVRHQDRLHQP